MGQQIQSTRARWVRLRPWQVRAEGKQARRLSGAFSLLLACVVTFCSMVLGGKTCVAQEIVVNREYTIKAAFLYQFSKYIKWPDEAFTSPDAPFVIGVYLSNPFDKKLDKIAASKKIAGRAIEIKLLDSPEGVGDCHILFLPRDTSEEDQLRLLKASEESAVLLVGESMNFVSTGGDVQFFVDANKVRFAFHEQVNDRRGLTISSKLLSLSKPIPATSSSIP